MKITILLISITFLPNNNNSPHPSSELLDLSHEFLLLNQVNDSRPISKGLQIIKVMHHPIGFGLGYPGIKRRGIVGFPPLKREHLLQLQKRIGGARRRAVLAHFVGALGDRTRQRTGVRHQLVGQAQRMQPLQRLRPDATTRLG